VPFDHEPAVVDRESPTVTSRSSGGNPAAAARRSRAVAAPEARPVPESLADIVADGIMRRLAVNHVTDHTAGPSPVGRIRRSTAMIRRNGDPVIEEVEDEPPLQWQPPAEIVAPAEPLLLAEGPWEDVAAEDRHEREMRLDPRYRAKLQEMARDDNPAPNKLGADRYVPLAARIDEQGKALAEHDKRLRAETGAVHGRSRHGWQTGAEGQKRRAKSKLTPEQPSDPMGTGSTTKEWTTSTGVEMMISPTNVAGNKKILEGLPVPKDVYAAVPEKSRKKPTKASKSGGPYAGSFFSPEHQNRLEAQALVKAAEFTKWTEAEFVGKGWKKIDFLDVVLNNEKGGYGISFSKGKGTSTVYAQKVTASGLYAGGGDVEPASSSALLGAADSDVDVYLMLCAKVQFKRVKDGWQVLSSFPENLEPGVSPIFNHGKDAWTGKVRSADVAEETLPAPNWLPDDDT
jgi:hypothetical protein